MTDPVSTYLARLQAALGTADFDAIFANMKADLNREQVNEVASSFVAKTPKSAKKRQSLDRIMARHNNILDARQKNAVLTYRGR